MKDRMLGLFLAVGLGVGLIAGSLAGCGGGNPYLDASLNPAELEGKDKAWFEKNWGEPTGKAPRFFGGETWTYFRISGGKTSAILGNFTPTECQITLKFDKESKLSSSSYSGC
jgi:hypothetical protein